ncbi:MAG TPA: hypothetical protein VEX38_05955 [Fimbriimonadaceae bacterium]|nr:hypothetical protein [Fimbriimonadaceae bacterium]
MEKGLYLLCWNPASTLPADLDQAGFDVEVESEDGGKAYRRLREETFAAVVFDMSKKPSHSLEVARAVGESKKMSALPLVFVDSAEVQREKLAGFRLQSAHFCTRSELISVLRDLTG